MNLDFTAELSKAEEIDGRYFVSGVASTTDKDQQNDIITANALQEMAKSALGVPIVTSHNHELNDEIGSIVDAQYRDNALHIKAELDATDPMAVRMYNKIAKAKKVGFSIGASVKKLATSVDKSVRMAVDSVQLNHLMITSRPVNKNTFCIALAKALEDEIMDKEVKPSPANPLPKEHEGEISIDGGEPKKIGPSIQERTDNKPEHNDLGHDMRKAGAKFSADTMASLNAIRSANSMDEVKGIIGNMLGDTVDNASDDSAPLGLVDKSYIADALAAFKEDLVKTLKVDLAKSSVEMPKAPPEATESEPIGNGRFTFHETLRKAIGG